MSSGLWSFGNREQQSSPATIQNLAGCNVFTAQRILQDAHRNDYGCKDTDSSSALTVTVGTPRLALLPHATHSDPAVTEIIDVIAARWREAHPEPLVTETTATSPMDVTPGHDTASDVTSGRSTARTSTSEGVADRLSRAEGRRQEIRELQRQRRKDAQAHRLQRVEQEVEAHQRREAAVLKERDTLRRELGILVEVAPNPDVTGTMKSTGFVGLQRRALERREARVALRLAYEEGRLRRQAEALSAALTATELEEESARDGWWFRFQNGLEPMMQLEREHRVRAVVVTHNRARLLRHYGFGPWWRFLIFQRLIAVKAEIQSTRRSLRMHMRAWRAYTANQNKVRNAVGIARGVATLRLVILCWKRALWRRWRATVVTHKAHALLAVKLSTKRLLGQSFMRWKVRLANVRHNRVEAEHRAEGNVITMHRRRVLRNLFKKWSAKTAEIQEQRARADYRQHLWSVVESLVKR